MTKAGTSRLLIATDKFKGSMTAAAVAASVARGVSLSGDIVEVDVAPLADGGDGSVAAAISAGFAPVAVECLGPHGELSTTTIAVRDGTAIVEIADICGVDSVGPDGLFPLTASTEGVGQAVLSAARMPQVTTVAVGLGGSITTDGGTGFLRALGATFTDADDEALAPGGGDLDRLASANLAPVRSALEGVRLVGLADVSAPLFGPAGAAAVFAPQKGADPQQVARLDTGLRRLAAIVELAEPRNRLLTGLEPGSGAAGGLGYAILSAGGDVLSGADWFLNLVEFDARVANADLVVTGEGSLDRQTLSGKLPAIVAARARSASVPTVAVVGRSLLSEAEAHSAGFSAVYAVDQLSAPVESACDPELTARLLEEIGSRWIAEQLRHAALVP